MLSIQDHRVASAGERTIKGKGSLPDCGTGIGRTALMPRRGVTAIAHIAHAVEDDEQIETWMIGQGQEPSGNRQIVVRRARERC
jgi:hypothetical protein